jgi:hypothetical protein
MVGTTLRGFGEARAAEEPSVMGPDTRPSMRADPAARQLGYEQGVPTPSSGAGTAARQVFTRITDPAKLAVYRRLRADGMSVEDIWRKIHIAQWRPGEYYGEIPGEVKVLRNWGTNESRAELGTLVDAPEVFDEINRHQPHGAKSAERLPVRRQQGTTGSATVSATPIVGEPYAAGMALGDTDMAEVASHELNHLVEGVQSGRNPGSWEERAWQQMRNEDPDFKQKSDAMGWVNHSMAEADQVSVKPGSPEYNLADELLNKAYERYLKDAGETRARISGVRDTWMTPAERQENYPFTVESRKSGGRFLRFDDIRATDRAYAGRDMVPDMNQEPDWLTGTTFSQSVSPRPAELALRYGDIEPTGAHFATRKPWSEGYWQPEQTDIRERYNIAKVNLLDTSNPQEVLPVLRDLAKDPKIRALKEPGATSPTIGDWTSASGENKWDVPGEYIRSSLARNLAKARRGESPRIEYTIAESAGLKDAAERRGFGGYKVFEEDDQNNPTTAFIWDLMKVRPKKRAVREKLEELLRNYEEEQASK